MLKNNILEAKFCLFMSLTSGVRADGEHGRNCVCICERDIMCLLSTYQQLGKKSGNNHIAAPEKK